MALKQLIENCKKNDRKSQKEIYELYAAKLYGSCLKYAATEQDAQDVLQDAFITIFKKIDQYKDKGSFEGWCRRIVINKALGKYRKNKLRTVGEDRLINIEADVEVKEVDDVALDDLLKFVRELPERYRLVFSLYVMDGYSHKEIAQMMEISEGTSKSNLSRARGLLQDKITVWRNSDRSSAI